ncbi:hypothetical protein [Paenarthrobacter sp. NEAU-H11]|uniref:hypothetical protein n=1 Tax=Paenarthrobacter sp. NEAU-H11 TaxID=3423924 RepID=UPI003D33972D
METATLQLTRPNTIESAEKFLQQIVSDSSQRLDLRIPHALKGDDLGGLASTLQVIATWARRNPHGRLRTYVPSTDAQASLESLLEHDHGLFSVLMAPAVLDKSGNDITYAARRDAIRRLDRIADFSGAKRGSEALIAAADHTSRHEPEALYTPASASASGKLRNEGAMARLVRQFGSLVQVGPRSKELLLQNAEPIAQILHELLDNTHRYARFHTDGLTALNPSVRLVKAEAVSQSLDVLVTRVKNQPLLYNYLRHESHQSPLYQESVVQDMRRFLEISVLDTGPGIAARRLEELRQSENPSLHMEISALFDCLRKHVTTSSNLSRGLGLDHVQSTLTTLRGFIRIRTGRVELIRDFIASPYSPLEDPVEKWDLDLAGQSRQKACGSLVTMLIPTNFRRGT